MDLKDISNKSVKAPEIPVGSEKRHFSFLLGVGILFLPYIFAWFTLRKGYSTRARVIAFVWLGFALITFMKKEDRPRNTIAETHLEQEVKTQPISESCLKVSGIFGAASNLSDLQKEELWPSFKGRRFDWKVSVTEVSKESFGDGFTVQYKCAGSSALIQDVMITYPASAKSEVLGLKKGGSYKISGKLTAYNSLLGLTAEP